MAQKLSSDGRNRFAEKIMDWGNLFFIAMTVAQGFGFSSNKYAIVVGTIGLVLAYYIAYRIMKRGTKK